MFINKVSEHWGAYQGTFNKSLNKEWSMAEKYTDTIKWDIREVPCSFWSPTLSWVSRKIPKILFLNNNVWVQDVELVWSSQNDYTYLVIHGTGFHSRNKDFLNLLVSWKSTLFTDLQVHLELQSFGRVILQYLSKCRSTCTPSHQAGGTDGTEYIGNLRNLSYRNKTSVHQDIWNDVFIGASSLWQ